MKALQPTTAKNTRLEIDTVIKKTERQDQNEPFPSDEPLLEEKESNLFQFIFLSS